MFHNLPYNPRIYPGSVRHTWLTAFFELKDWARHNYISTAELLPTERLALAVHDAASALMNAGSAYGELSRHRLELALRGGDPATAARIRAADQRERRRLLIELRRARPTLLRAFFNAAARYWRARAAVPRIAG
jgi:hypothetical protein